MYEVACHCWCILVKLNRTNGVLWNIKVVRSFSGVRHTVQCWLTPAEKYCLLYAQKYYYETKWTSTNRLVIGTFNNFDHVCWHWTANIQNRGFIEKRKYMKVKDYRYWQQNIVQKEYVICDTISWTEDIGGLFVLTNQLISRLLTIASITTIIAQSHSPLLPTCFTSSLKPASYITQDSSSELLIRLSATFIWTCRFNLLHTAITFHHFFTVSLWAQNYLFRKSYPPP